ncbi:unnamed protein product [Toxocara canis]|uniref:G_PROTEIN_RECEP_F1_2 domain-containing protein n=1 Tax=Toxocara canis TaxID=6265 RepID=A0A183UG68_TOXCA|nr:unnamed protein product [Toxocara canis]
MTAQEFHERSNQKDKRGVTSSDSNRKYLPLKEQQEDYAYEQTAFFLINVPPIWSCSGYSQAANNLEKELTHRFAHLFFIVFGISFGCIVLRRRAFRLMGNDEKRTLEYRFTLVSVQKVVIEMDLLISAILSSLYFEFNRSVNIRCSFYLECVDNTLYYSHAKSSENVLY